MELLKGYLIKIVAIFIVITLHEFSKALTSTLQGDILPKEKGALTLNPIRHFEPIGFILMLFFNFGWGKPVETSALYYKERRKGVIITYTVPIIVDLIIAFIFSVAMQLFVKTGILNIIPFYIEVLDFFKNIITIAIYLAIINVIPVYPFCGNKILSVCLNPNASIKYNQYEKILQIVVLMLLFFGVIPRVTDVIAGFIYKLFLFI